MSNEIWLINGPNLNMLGKRETAKYGNSSLAEIEQNCKATAEQLNLLLDCFQSNHEGKIVDKIQQIRESASGIIINTGAYSHTSIAILDALNMYEGKVIEVHVSNIYAREEFRHYSYISQRADGIIAGLGPQVYELAVQGMSGLLNAK